jgi:hypothetical protein
VGLVVNQDPQFEAPLIAGLAQKGLSVAWRGAPIAGLNYSKGDDVTLKIGEIVAAPTRIPARGPQR